MWNIETTRLLDVYILLQHQHRTDTRLVLSLSTSYVHCNFVFWNYNINLHRNYIHVVVTFLLLYQNTAIFMDTGSTIKIQLFKENAFLKH